MLKIYESPGGLTYQYEDGEQPEGFVEVKAAPKPRNKARVPPSGKRRGKAGDA